MSRRIVLGCVAAFPVWALDGSTGAVIRRPQGLGDPPGMYPSPTRPGSLELWTGVMWLRHFADDPAHPVR